MKSIKINSNGSEVLLLQQLLNKKGYKVAEDGDFGAKTQKAVMSFQKDFGLVADGVVGDKTWSVILGKETPYFYLSEEDFQECADLLNVDVAAVKICSQVAVSGSTLPPHATQKINAITKKATIIFLVIRSASLNTKCF